ncbi:MAG: cytochrome b/b6 domain-containing protein [Mariprofundaceae bacterium]|nr:cytochrome b/b6 domain-containing protein [Mariprofundaceae bacterium]
MPYKPATKILHWLIMLSVGTQLFSQYWMFVPAPDKEPQAEWMAWLFICHLLIGILALCFVSVRLMSVLENNEDQKQLFPWLSKKGLFLLINEIKKIPSWLNSGPPKPEQKNKVATTVHGLGLLLLFALGSTGILFFIGIDTDGAMNASTRFFRESHEIFAILLYLYLSGHIGMLMVHLSQGQKQILSIFSTKEEKD